MRGADAANIADGLPVEALRGILREHPVGVAILFGSHTNGKTHSESDIDIAVELEGYRPGQRDYNEAFFGLSADVSVALGTDDVDLVDVHTLSPSLARSVLTDGVLLVGDFDRVEELRRQLTADENDDRSPRERLDEALRSIDEHLA